MISRRRIKLANTSSSLIERLQIPSDLLGAQAWMAPGADLTVRLVQPQFELGFTNAILLMNVDYLSLSGQHTKFERYASI
jgi:hypothetical protein